MYTMSKVNATHWFISVVYILVCRRVIYLLFFSTNITADHPKENKNIVCVYATLSLMLGRWVGQKLWVTTAHLFPCSFRDLGKSVASGVLGWGQGREELEGVRGGGEKFRVGTLLASWFPVTIIFFFLGWQSSQSFPGTLRGSVSSTQLVCCLFHSIPHTLKHSHSLVPPRLHLLLLAW